MVLQVSPSLVTWDSTSEIQQQQRQWQQYIMSTASCFAAKALLAFVAACDRSQLP
jgi:hypothetical protein